MTYLLDKKPGAVSVISAHPWQALTAVFALALCALAPVHAASVSVDPVSIEITADKQTATLTVSNDSDQPTSMQAQVYAWSQRNGKDVYTQTRDLLVSPPVVTIAPKSEQVFRVALRRKPDAARELTYRIYLQELPQKPAPGFTGLRFALRIGLPVFVKQVFTPKMVWGVARAPDGRLKVTLHNQGNGHVQVTDFAFYAPGSDKPIAGELGSTYVLADQTHEWLLKANLPATAAGGSLRLKAYTDAGNVDTELTLQKP